MKNIAYLIHVPAIIIGAIVGTIYFGFMQGMIATVEWWENTEE